MSSKIGKKYKTKENYIIIVVEYNNYDDVWVEFQDEYRARVHTGIGNCKRGEVKNPYHPNKFGGYIGVGDYKASINGKQTKCYKDWFSLMQRGFDEEFKKKHPTYKDVIVNPEIYNFQNFAEWWHSNFYEVDGERMEIDKDILYKGNKEYRFDRMIFVPHKINSLFVKCDASRGNYPIGVSYKKDKDKYEVHCSTLEGRKFLGYYNTPEEAFNAYKEFKEAYIKEIANKYRYMIPKELYDGMYRWEVEITD